ncbi:glycosyltransferase family 39 protein [Paenibacillus sp. GCM10023252]|uniref:glycosyltransferase family 39 protein n=1 Tax=Paenibacillus sp. GCM10023252 TaxID=3252649 RepID=UPI003618E911
MMKKVTALMGLFLLTLLFLTPPSQVQGAGGNLLSDSGFESGTAGSWKADEWTPGTSTLAMTKEVAHSGAGAAHIVSASANHAKWLQTIQVEPNKIYRLSSWVKVLSAGPNAAGAGVFVGGVGESLPELRKPSEEWQQVVVYGRTGESQTELQAGVAVGGYGSLNTGEAYFDDVLLEKVNDAPQDATIYDFSGGGSAPAPTPEQKPPVRISALPVLLFSALFWLLFVLVKSVLLRSTKQAELARTSRSIQRWTLAAIAAGLALRIGIAIAVHGYSTDLNTFMYWAQHAYEHGLPNFYQEGMFADYPPGYLYVLYVIGAIRTLLDLPMGSDGATLLLKLPAILADLATGYLIYRLGWSKLGHKAAFGLSLLYLFNPAVLVNSSAWGQVDSFFAMFLLLALYAVKEGKTERGVILFAVTVLIKPQALIFTPVLLLILAWRGEWKRTLLSALYGAGAFAVLAAPFFWSNGGVSAIIKLYRTTLESYPYASVNAFNLFNLTGGNWQPLEKEWMWVSYSTWGNLAIVLAVASAVWLFLGKQGRKLAQSGSSGAFYIGLVLIAIMFIVGAKMHERYLFPAILLCIFSYMEMKDRRILHLLLGLSVTHFINVGYVLAYSAHNQHPESHDGIVIVSSILNLGLLIYMFIIGYDWFWKGRTIPLEPATDAQRREEDERLLAAVPQSAGHRLTRKDWWWMGGITLLYTVVALIQLGDMRGPETSWKPASVNESFYVDLGETKQLSSVHLYGGVGRGKYMLEFGNSLDGWNSPLTVEEGVGRVFQWNALPLTVSARYVKLTVLEKGFALHEIAFYQGSETKPLRIESMGEVAAGSDISKKGSFSALFDEQAKVPYKPSYKNGTYFDEIYHARTAYEHIEGIVPYESTHPPLGKLLIAIGIKLFGLNPFGWRIVGTLFGAAMLPLIYLFARQLFGKPEYAAAAAGLFAVDFMHFVQTRIATIDVYGVFFILIMFYFMYRYYTVSFYEVPLRKTLLPLFLAGLFFGIGAASKWIVIYGGIGLAVMLGLSLFERYVTYRAAKRKLAGRSVPEAARERYEHIVNVFPRYTVLTLTVCVLFYVVIPLAIYAAAFIPTLTAEDRTYTLQGLINEQKHMLDYHSELVATHPFASSWWEWPFMKRPVWYYSGNGSVSPDQVSSIVALGNPLIWWAGIFAVVAAIWLSIKRKDRRMYIIWIAFLSQYLPWMLVPRLTFIYHYFAMVPFLILSIVYLFSVWEAKQPAVRRLRMVYIGSAVLLFLLFYPVLSGMIVSEDYVEAMLRWFSSWVFYS